ncbi:hypothetical protein [Actinokineospora sp. HUAS TT18]|uniref:hypothetical protein n=1 Tax=Actinokineospora sp. HUAS TT18 TaxID=3447451 RepID=UPI003F5225BA
MPIQSSIRLGLLIATANLAVCACVAVVLHLATKPAASAAAITTTSDSAEPARTTTTRTTTTRPTQITTTTDALAGFTRVSGPGGMSTLIPAGWPQKTGTGPGNLEATDPAGNGRNVKYGGAPHDGKDLLTSHIEYAQTVSTRPGYRQLQLGLVSFHGGDAVDWEFVLDSGGGTRHVRSLYWRRDGYEFFVYAGSQEELWPETQAILNTMIDNATP